MNTGILAGFERCDVPSLISWLVYQEKDRFQHRDATKFAFALNDVGTLNVFSIFKIRQMSQMLFCRMRTQ